MFASVPSVCYSDGGARCQLHSVVVQLDIQVPNVAHHALAPVVLLDEAGTLADEFNDSYFAHPNFRRDVNAEVGGFWSAVVLLDKELLTPLVNRPAQRTIRVLEPQLMRNPAKGLGTKSRAHRR